MNDKATAAQVLEFLDTFAGQENTAEEVRDFVQLAARYIDEGKPVEDWKAEPMLFAFAEWREEQFDRWSGERSDRDIAIGEHAFKAGYKIAAARARAYHPTKIEDSTAHMEAAWSEYTPPDELCGG